MFKQVLFIVTRHTVFFNCSSNISSTNRVTAAIGKHIVAKNTLTSAYRSMGDSQGKLENFYLGQAATGQSETPEELAKQVRDVTPERIFRAMDTVQLDTVYFLRGKEAEA